MEKTTIQCTNVSSNLEWADSPDMLEVVLTKEVVERAERTAAFLEAEGIHSATTWDALTYEMYEECEEEESVVSGKNGEHYKIFNPEYRVDGCGLKVFASGTMQAVIPLKHSDERIWVDIGSVASIKAEHFPEPEVAQEAIAAILNPPVNQTPSTVPVKYWDCYSDDEAVMTHQIEVEDYRKGSGQLAVTVAALEGSLDDMLPVTLEINTNPLNGLDHVPCAHIHFDESNLALSLFKVGNKIIMRPESDVWINNIGNGLHEIDTHYDRTQD